MLHVCLMGKVISFHRRAVRTNLKFQQQSAIIIAKTQMKQGV